MAAEPLLRRARRGPTRRLRRLTRNPFAGERVLLVHGAHHKAGTVWVRRVLAAVAYEYGLRFFGGVQERLPAHADVFFQNTSVIDASALPAFRGSHMIRDPRDLVISGYHYHLRTTEAWAHEPRERLGGLSYQEHLRTCTEDEGIHTEIDRVAKMSRQMVAWDYDDDRFLNLRYEDLIDDERAGFAALFEHYGFTPAAVRRSVDVAEGFSLARAVTIDDRHGSAGHVRSGRPGEWRERFGEEHRAHFKEVANDVLVSLGYESDDRW